MSISTAFTPLQFTGISQYSTDFQSIITRAVSIAQIPVRQLSNESTNIDQQQTELSTLNGAVSSVGQALKALGHLGSTQALSVTSSDSSVVSVTNVGATAPASYSITNVASLATPAAETSLTGYPNGNSTPVSSTGTMQLVYGNNKYTINLSPAQNNLAGVQKAINDLGVGVSASVLTTGGANGNYLSLSTSTPGSTTLKLIDDPSGTAHNALTSNNQGTNTVFNLNGIQISTPGTTVNNVIPGVSLKFGGKTAANETVSVNLASDPTQISSALQTLASTYNALKTQIQGQIGTNAGLLSGNNIIYQIRSAMSSIVQFSGSGAFGNLANLGIAMSQDGTMSFNQDTFNSLSSSQIASAFTLLGSSTSGIGGLQTAFTTISDPVAGTIKAQQDQWTATNTHLTSQISTMTDRINSMEQTLNQQLQKADASIALLASQQNTLTASIQSLNYTAYGYNTNNTASR